MLLLATDTLGTVMIAVVFIALPVAALAFALGSEDRYREIGKGDLMMESDYSEGLQAPPPADSAEVREEEIRQMIQARSDRGVAKGRKPLNVDAEVQKVLDEPGPDVGSDPQLREEVRQLVVARNERRMRQGKEPLDVEKEIERQLSELENLGQ
jgi:hypothetical protein